MVDLKTLDEETLYSIWSDCRENKWPEVVGTKPDEFDILPNEKRWYQIFIRRTKQDYLHPIGIAARGLISKEYLRARLDEELKRAEDANYLCRNDAAKILTLCYGVVPRMKWSESEAIIEYCSKYPR